MTIKKTLITTALAGFTLAASAAGAYAASAVATGTVNVRTGPGTGYGVVDSLYRGERVEVNRCRGSWCFVERRGPDGWVSSSFLANSDDYRDRPTRRPPPPRYYDDYDDGYYMERPRRPHRPYYDGYDYPRYPRNNSACFGSPGMSFCFSD